MRRKGMGMELCMLSCSLSLGYMLMDLVRPLFERALAELKYLGLIKGTRKKTDHIAKAAWRGL
jgi:hypothetical protein